MRTVVDEDVYHRVPDRPGELAFPRNDHQLLYTDIDVAGTQRVVKTVNRKEACTVVEVVGAGDHLHVPQLRVVVGGDIGWMWALMLECPA